MARHCAQGDQVRYLTRKRASGGIAGAFAFVGDLTSPVADLQEFVRGADVLYHCAAELHDVALMHRTNVLGTANLITAAGGEIGRWVQLSSTGVYGRNVPGEVFEDTGVNPSNAYEISKEAADHVVREANLPSVIVRPSNVYGADMPNQSLYQLIKAIDRGLFFFIGPPGAVANYVHVENVVDALMLCATAELPANGRTYIVSDPRTLEELVRAIAAPLGRAAPRLRLPEPLIRAVSMLARRIPGFPLSPSRVDALTSRTVYRTGRITAELGYDNRISLEAGMAELVHHWKSRPAHG